MAYAAPNGTGTLCTHSEPCTVLQAVTLAKNASVAPTIRMLPGLYVEDVTLLPTLITSTPLEVVATGATLTGSATLDANLQIRGITIAGFLVCLNSTIPPLAGLAFRDSTINPRGSVSTNKCRLEMVATELTASVSLGSDSTFEADRIHMHASQALTISSSGSRATLRITNSVLEDVTTSFLGSSDNNQFTLAFNTIVLSSGNPQICPTDTAVNRSLRFEDNVLLSLVAQTNVISGTSCTLLHNILFPQATAIANNIVADPQIVDAVGKNFHLKSTSPAIDAAIPSSGLESDHDFEGTSRPQGATPDIGAFELAP